MSDASSIDLDAVGVESELESLPDIKLPFAFARRFGVVLGPDQ
jgi:hypothetical protein